MSVVPIPVSAETRATVLVGAKAAKRKLRDYISFLFENFFLDWLDRFGLSNQDVQAIYFDAYERKRGRGKRSKEVSELQVQVEREEYLAIVQMAYHLGIPTRALFRDFMSDGIIYTATQLGYEDIEYLYQLAVESTKFVRETGHLPSWVNRELA